MFLLNRSFVIFILIIILLGACGGAPETAVATPVAPPAVTRMPIQATEDVFTVSLSEIVGGVLARTAQEPGFSEVKNGYIVQLLGQVQTQTGGRARLDFSTGSLVRLGPNTLFTLQPPEEDSQGLLIRIRLEVGRIWVILQGGSLEVETKSGVAAVRGSYMSVSYNPDSGEASITCLEGDCSLSTAGGSVQITAGQTAVVTGVGEPPQVGDMDDQDVQDWLNNNPEATVVVPGLTETPVVVETSAATDVPPTSVPPLPPVVVNPPVPTAKAPPREEPQPTAMRTVQPALTSTGTATATQMVPPVLTSTGTVTATRTAPPALTLTSTATSTQTALPTKTPTGTATPTPIAEPPPPVIFVPGVVITNFGPIPAIVGQSVDVYITVYPDPNGPIPTGTVQVISGGNPLCTASLIVGSTESTATCSFIPMAAGGISINAYYPGDGNYYDGSSPSEPLTVITGTTTAITMNPNPYTTGNLVTFSANVVPVPPGAGSPTGSVTFYVSSGVSCVATPATSWQCSITLTSSGPLDVYAIYSGDANFVGSTSPTVRLDFYMVLASQPSTSWACDPSNNFGQIH
jgi:hypothetical protein